MIANILLVISGVIIASTSMAIGIGSGILWAPLFIVGYGLTTAEAVSTSLLIQVVGLGSGSLSYFKLGLMQKKLSFLFYLVAVPGLVAGSVLTLSIPQQTVQMMLGVMSLLIALLFVAGREQKSEAGTFTFDFREIRFLLPTPVVFGFFMGFLSTGIGEWLIPSMRNRLNIEMTRCVATIVPMMFLLAVTASLLHWTQSANVQVAHFFWGGVGVAIGGQLGPRLSNIINERVLKETFIFLMTLVGIHLVFQSI